VIVAVPSLERTTSARAGSWSSAAAKSWWHRPVRVFGHDRAPLPVPTIVISLSEQLLEPMTCALGVHGRQGDEYV
jgi:hypothetical protein